jgi:TRAP-type C4-dicarboxylate transport system permease small subunit
VVCWFLAEASWTFVQDEMTFETIAFADVPAWYLQIIIPIGFLMMMFRFLILLIQNLVQLLSGNKEPA